MVALPAMKTWADQERVRTDDLNDQIRDAINFAMDPPHTVVYRTTTTNFPTGTTYVSNTWEATQFDNNAGWAPGTPTRLLINTPGKYMIDAKYQWANYATGYRSMHIRLNAAGNPSLGTYLGGDLIQPIPSAATPIKFQVPQVLAFGDYLEMFMYQTSGATQTTIAGVIGGYLSARWIGPP